MRDQLLRMWRRYRHEVYPVMMCRQRLVGGRRYCNAPLGRIAWVLYGACWRHR